MNPTPSIEIGITEASTADDQRLVRSLFLEYAAELNVDLCFEGFDDEVANLPGRYAAPDGRLLLAYANGEPAGCVALRRIGDAECEMKRLYVRDRFRGLGIGRRLATSLIVVARQVGYRVLKLDSLESMTAARKLYESLGFTETAPYGYHCVEKTCYLALILESPVPSSMETTMAETGPTESTSPDSIRDRVTEALRTVYDPEIPVNIMELGLVYRLGVTEGGRVEIDMTLTSPNCPVAGSLVAEVERKTRESPGVAEAKVNLVWDPPWTQDRMSEAARLELNMDLEDLPGRRGGKQFYGIGRIP